MIKDIFKIENIVFDSTAKAKIDALKFIASFAEKEGIVKSSKAYYKGLKKRESEVTTGFKDGIAIPHCKHKTVLKPSLMVVKFSNTVEWDSMDGKPVQITFALAIPEGENQAHLKLLSSISRALIDEEFTEAILNAETESEMYAIIQEKMDKVND
ncbi:fructose-specific phosphotransferase system IIA component [Virgibacillus halotolerans]|uniref:PTS sugar transporter subunit IIA n=1 Tax=Virgibacillus halotolerans TaxID=1071053 RepID=UPI0019601979|nr:PTS sugar transporter subunit IIA [Virgibacillus halotolerans]MBM7598914.1 fructose-specific phosphotransferase system IIA component [Virgibacillus halotolerans]